MNQLFLPYELAVMAKEKGFDDHCFMFYYNNGKGNTLTDDAIFKTGTDSNPVNAPLYQQIFDWLESVKKIKVRKIPSTSGVDWWEIWRWQSQRDSAGYWKQEVFRPENINEAIKKAFELI